MSSRIYWVHEFDNKAKIGIMARPRGNEWLEDEVLSLKRRGVDILVSLLEKEEISELGLGQEEAMCNQHGIKFQQFPVKDRSLPGKSVVMESFIQGLYNEIVAGSNVVVHCRMGIGRSSIIAGAVILKSGRDAAGIMSKISHVRGLTVPDTREQLHWLLSRENKNR